MLWKWSDKEEFILAEEILRPLKERPGITDLGSHRVHNMRAR